MALVARREDRARRAGIEGGDQLGGARLQGVAVGGRQEVRQHQEAVAVIGGEVDAFIGRSGRSRPAFGRRAGRRCGSPGCTIAIAWSASASLAAWTRHSGLPVRTSVPTSITSVRPTDGSIASSAWARPPPSATTAMPTSRAFMPATWPDRSAVQGWITAPARDSARCARGNRRARPTPTTMRRELLGRAAVVQRRLGARPAGGDARRQAAQRQHLAGQRHRHLVQARIARALALQVVDGLDHLERIADIAAQHAVHVGDQRDGRQAGLVGDGHQAFAPGRAPSPRCRRRRPSRISRPSPARRGRRQSSSTGSSSRSAGSIRRSR